MIALDIGTRGIRIAYKQQNELKTTEFNNHKSLLNVAYCGDQSYYGHEAIEKSSVSPENFIPGCKQLICLPMDHISVQNYMRRYPDALVEMGNQVMFHLANGDRKRPRDILKDMLEYALGVARSDANLDHFDSIGVSFPYSFSPEQKNAIISDLEEIASCKVVPLLDTLALCLYYDSMPESNKVSKYFFVVDCGEGYCSLSFIHSNENEYEEKLSDGISYGMEVFEEIVLEMMFAKSPRLQEKYRSGNRVERYTIYERAVFLMKKLGKEKEVRDTLPFVNENIVLMQEHFYERVQEPMKRFVHVIQSLWSRQQLDWSIEVIVCGGGSAFDPFVECVKDITNRKHIKHGSKLWGVCGTMKYLEDTAKQPLTIMQRGVPRPTSIRIVQNNSIRWEIPHICQSKDEVPPPIPKYLLEPANLPCQSPPPPLTLEVPPPPPSNCFRIPLHRTYDIGVERQTPSGQINVKEVIKADEKLPYCNNTVPSTTFKTDKIDYYLMEGHGTKIMNYRKIYKYELRRDAEHMGSRVKIRCKIEVDGDGFVHPKFFWDDTQKEIEIEDASWVNTPHTVAEAQPYQPIPTTTSPPPPPRLPPPPPLPTSHTHVSSLLPPPIPIPTSHTHVLSPIPPPPPPPTPTPTPPPTPLPPSNPVVISSITPTDSISSSVIVFSSPSPQPLFSSIGMSQIPSLPSSISNSISSPPSQSQQPLLPPPSFPSTSHIPPPPPIPQSQSIPPAITFSLSPPPLPQQGFVPPPIPSIPFDLSSTTFPTAPPPLPPSL